ncbi:MAG: helix-turn-helix transcriptional regulator, partial [Nitrospirota bacterium]
RHKLLMSPCALILETMRIGVPKIIIQGRHYYRICTRLDYRLQGDTEEPEIYWKTCTCGTTERDKRRKQISIKAKEAVERYGYSQKEVADYLGIHYSTVSRMVNKGI